ncbi:hypothetical protein [Cytobacillus praedii]|uniref:hypothetical protein n=1 Tax=Cytobacillus praedii TaxID=1742358 RepID=UPI002E1BD015|nr:hypothetical protein [Cytobacillus praedii]
MVFILAFIIVIILKFILNIRKYFQCEKYISLFEDWIVKECKINLVEKRSIVKKLVSDAGYGNSRVPYVKEMGYGQLARLEVNPIDSFPNREMARGILNNLSASKGLYKQRALEAFNPIFWIEFVIFLPKSIFSYLGVESTGFIVKISNLIWWLLGTVLTTMILNAFSPELSEFIRSIFK